MPNLKLLRTINCICLGIVFVPPSVVLGANVVFNVNPTESQITLSGNLVAYGALSAPLEAQQPGSLTDNYGGTINVDLSESNIEFTGSSLITAQTNASPQQPAPGGAPGSSPANYGGLAQEYFFYEITAYIAIRGLALDVTSPVEGVTNGAFSATSLQFSFSTNEIGSIDYDDNIGDSGTETLAGSSMNSAGATATLSTNAGIETLVIPVNMAYTENTGALDGTTLYMVGQIVATRSLTVPIIDSIIVTNQTVFLSVENATPQSQVLVSSNLTTWSEQTSETETNNSGLTTFTLPGSGGAEFFRIQQ